MVYRLQQLIVPMTGDFRGCDTPELLVALREVFDDFCERTGAWRETITQDLVADQEEYLLPTASGDCFIHRVIEVEQNGTIRSERTDWDFDGEATLTLNYPSSAAVTDGLVVEVALRPAFNIAEAYVSKNFLQHWQATIKHGVRAHMYGKPEKPYSNPVLSDRFEGKYESGIVRALIEADRQRKHGNEPRVELQRMWVN